MEHNEERDREYEERLDDLVDELFEEAAERWSWSEFASAAGVADSTVWNLGTRKTRLPYLRTIWKLAKALGWDVGTIRARTAKRRAA